MILAKTALYQKHVAMGATMVPFKNTMLPVRFQSEIEEHAAVRNTIGIFDVSHMGEFIVSGSHARAFLQMLLTNNIDKLSEGSAHYSLMLNEDGGIIDDLIVYQVGKHCYLICVNAGNLERDWQHIITYGAHRGACTIENVSHNYAQLALQGPKSANTLSRLTSAALPDRFCITSLSLAGIDALVARTGYSGADGFEIFVNTAHAESLYDALFHEGQPLGLIPCGLAARDSLRIEAGLLLHGQDMDETTSPQEAGLMFAVDMTKHGFVGKDALLRHRPVRKLMGFKLLDRGLARHGFSVLSEDLESIGTVTSATYLADKKCSVGFASLTYQGARRGRRVLIDIRGRHCRAELCTTRFLSL